MSASLNLETLVIALKFACSGVIPNRITTKAFDKSALERFRAAKLLVDFLRVAVEIRQINTPKFQ